MFVINLNYLNKRGLEGNFLKVADFTGAAIHINTTGKQNREGIVGKGKSSSLPAVPSSMLLFG